MLICIKLDKVGRSLPKQRLKSVVENVLEVGYVNDMSEVYKIPMTRMYKKLSSRVNTDEIPNVRVYTGNISKGI